MRLADLSHDAKSAPLVARALELFARGKHSKNAVLATVTDQGLRTKGGKPLSPQTFDKLLRNPLCAGWMTSKWGITQKGAFDPIVSVDVSIRCRIGLPAAVPPAVKPDRLRIPNSRYGFSCGAHSAGVV